MIYDLACEPVLTPERSSSTRQELDKTLQVVLDALPAHIVVLDEIGTIIGVNTAWRRFAQANGYAGADYGLGVNYLNICWQSTGPDATDARAVEQGIRAVLANEQADFRYDYACHGPDQQRWFQLRALRCAGDGPIRVIVTHEDITRHKRLEALFDLAQDAFLLADDQGHYIDANAAACALTGYSRSELLCMTVADLTPIADRASLAVSWLAFIEAGVLSGEYTILRKDGSCVLVEFRAVARIAPGVHFAALRDITARRQAEDGLRYRAERLSVLHAIDQAILAAGSLEEVAHAALRATHRLIPYWRGSVIVFEFEFQEFQVVAVRTNGEAVPGTPKRYSIAEVVKAEEIIATLLRGDVCVLDLHDLAPYWPEAETMLAAGLRYQICTPLIAHGELFGSLQLVTDTLETFTAQYMPIVREIVGSLAIALRQARLFEQVRGGRERLQELSRRLVAAQELERRQLARNLHDQIGQNLAVLNVNLSITRNQLSSEPSARLDARLLEAIRIVDETVDQIRNVMMELRPSILDDYGLPAALRWYTKHFVRQTDLAVLLEIEEPPSAPRLPADIETALFRIAQEALTNIVKHAHATLATLKLTMLDQSIRVEISDDGVGFNAGPVRRPNTRLSLGLMTMQERVEAFGGQLLIESAPGQGTRIVAEVTR